MPKDIETHAARGSKTITGGLKEFFYSKETLERLENAEDVTRKEFREEYNFWKEHPYKFWWKYNKDEAIVFLVLLIIFFIVLKYNGII